MSRVHISLIAAIATLIALGGNPSASAQFETRGTSPMPPGAYSLAVGDFNNDGKPDIVVVVDNGFAVALGRGDGTFGPAVSYDPGVVDAVAVADFNGDGNPDIVVANFDPANIGVYLGNGDGTFQPPIVSDVSDAAGFIAVGDFNHDGKPDIVILDHPYISVLLGNGDGTFRPPIDNDSFEIPSWLAVGDFNNDNRLDVVVVGSFGESYNVGVLLGNGDGTLQNSLTYPLEYEPFSVAAGEFNGDGNLDAVLGYYLGGIAVLLGNGNGGFQPTVNYPSTGLGAGWVVLSDLNLGGNLDVMSPDAPGVDVYWGNGNGTFQPPQGFGTSDAGIPAVADLNGDHLPDIVMANGDVGAISMLNTGIVTFSPTTAPLTFPVQLINTKSPEQTVSLTNNGTDALSIRSIKFSGQQFQTKSTCGGTVEPGASCSFSASFETKTQGSYTGLITIVDSASSKPQFVELTGTATAVKVSPESLDFGNQKVGTKSIPQTLTATNKGGSAVTFQGVGLQYGGSEFSSTNNCMGQPLEPGASCKASVTFKPRRKGKTSAMFIFLLPSGSVSPALITLTGTGD